MAGRAADTVLYRLRRAFINPFTVILFILASISFLTDVVLASNFSRNITTVVIILCMLLISGLVRFVQELRAKHVEDHLTGMVATSVLVRRDGRWQNLSSAELAAGEDTFYGGFTVTSVCRKNGFDQGANYIAWVLIRFMAVLIPVVFIACGLTKGNWGSAFLFALSVAVGLTPEMLPMVINACLAKGSAAMGKKQTVVKNINAMQGFGNMDILCVDKTGTLTGDRISLEYYMDILGNESQKVLDLAYLNSLYHTGVKNHLDDAILWYRQMPGRQEHFRQLEADHQKLDELPFDYDRKFASVLVRAGEENLLIIKGSLEQVCRRCRYVEYKGQRLDMTKDAQASVHAVVDEMLEDGMKVLALACKPMSRGELSRGEEKGFTLLGYLAFFDAPKKSAAAAIGRLQQLHVGVRVLTGDHRDVAVSVCRRLGLDTAQTLTGEELDRLPEEERPPRVERTTVFAELSPRQKVEILKTLQANGHTVGFLGDGMNDLPAMKAADIGISVDTAVDVAKKSADIILLEKDLMVLEQGIIEGRKTYANMIKYIKMTASSNFSNMFSVLAASALLPFLPMMSVHLIFLNLIYDLSCTAIPWDNVDEEFIAKPKKWDASSVGSFMIWIGPASSVFDFTTYLFMYFVFCPLFVSGGVLFHQLPARFGGAELALMQAKYIGMFQAGWFVESMWSQTLVIHMIRTAKLPFIQSRASAPLSLLTMTGVALLTIIPFTPLGTALGFVALPAAYFAYLIPCILLYMVLATILKKAYVRHHGELL